MTFSMDLPESDIHRLLCAVLVEADPSQAARVVYGAGVTPAQLRRMANAIEQWTWTFQDRVAQVPGVPSARWCPGVAESALALFNARQKLNELERSRKEAPAG